MSYEEDLYYNEIKGEVESAASSRYDKFGESMRDFAAGYIEALFACRRITYEQKETLNFEYNLENIRKEKRPNNSNQICPVCFGDGSVTDYDALDDTLSLGYSFNCSPPLKTCTECQGKGKV